MHDHSLFWIIFDMPFDSHWACVSRGSGARAWLFAHLVILCFHLPSNIFSFALQIKLDLPHPLTLGLTHCIWDHPLDLMGIHFFCCAHGVERTYCMMSFEMFLCPLWETSNFMFCGIKSIFSHNYLFKLFIGGSKLFYQLMDFADWSMLSLFTPLEQTWYHMWFFFMGWLQLWWFKWRKDFIVIITQQMCFSFLP
jgi:hypothetical protein